MLVGIQLAACTGQAAPGTPTAAAGHTTPLPAITVIAAPTPTATPPPPTETSVPPTFTPMPTTAPAAPCVNDAKFIADVTVPDGTHFLPGEAVNKKWSVKNTGTCDWGPDYRLVLIGGDSLGAPSAVVLYPAKAGATVTLEIPMTAPQTPSQYTGKWQARDPAGNLFGSVVFIKIEVTPLGGTSTP